MKKNKPRKIGTAKRQKDRKAMRGQINDLEIANIKLQAENEKLKEKLYQKALGLYTSEDIDTAYENGFDDGRQALKGE